MMKDPISVWNDTIYPSCDYLFKLFEEIADFNSMPKLDAYPIAQAQWMEISYERMTEIYKVITGKVLTTHIDSKFIKCAVSYGDYVSPKWFIEDDSNKMMLTISPCDVDILCKRVRMSALELHMLIRFTELLGLKDPETMKEYRVQIYTNQSLKSMEIRHRAMLVAAK